jgi:hypothetical protein
MVAGLIDCHENADERERTEIVEGGMRTSEVIIKA